MNIRCIFVVVVILVVHPLAVPTGAQQGQAAMTVGEVRDASGAVLAHATVTVSSPSLIGGAQAATTGSEGLYQITALSPGDYVVTAAASGFRPQRHSAVTLLPGATVTVDFILTPAGVEETVTVTAAEPSALDVRTSASSTVIRRPLLDNLPLNRTVSSYVNLVPGVVGFFDVGVVAFGSSSMANPFTLDGASGNDPAFGTPSMLSGVPAAAPSSSWIEEVQVVALGADAQFGEYTGAPINAITRSGSNAFAGTADYWTTRPNWVANNRGSLSQLFASRFRPLDLMERWSATAQLGGPIRHDKLWFFTGVDVYRNITRPAGFAAIASPPEDTVAALNEPKWLGKLSAAPHASVRFETYLARDRSTTTGRNASPTVKPEALKTERVPEILWNTRVTWVVSDHTFVEGQHGGHSTRDTYGPGDPNAIFGPPGHSDTITGISSVNATSYSDELTRPINASIALTRSTSPVNGRSHQVKAGFEYEYGRQRQENGYPGGMLFFDVNGKPDTVSIQAPTTYRPDHQRETLYLQDTWSASGRLTVNGGARVGFYRGAISGGPTQFSAKSFSPRIGVAWDVLPRHTLAVRGHYGRYHEAMVTGYYDFLDPLSQTTFISAQVLGPNQFNEIERDVPTDAYRIDQNIKYPYADEWLAGLDRELPGHVSLTAQYIGRRYGSIVGFVGSLADWTAVQRPDPGPDGVPGTADDGEQRTIFFNPGTNGFNAVLTNPDGAYKRYNGLQLIATRRASGVWEGQASYTWSRTRASFNSGFSSNAAQSDLGTNGVYANPNRALFADGRPAADFTHEIKVLGTLRLPWWGGTRVSSVYRYETGPAWARLVRFAGPTGFPNIAVEPRGTRETAATNVCDLRVEKTFRVALAAVGVYLDVFNLMNQGIANRVNAVSGPNFGTPSAWSDPRVLRAGLRVGF
jgi:Carboxypeptidase regulatory-like domain/TonB dependent receptor-like, beta-barrel